MSDEQTTDVATTDPNRNRYVYGIPDLPEDQPSQFTLQDDPEAIVEMLSLFHPQVQNAQMTVEDNGDLRFVLQAGEKGA